MAGTIERYDGGRRRIWYAQPAPALARYVTAYDAYDVALDPGHPGSDVFPPGWGAIRLSLTDDPWSVQLWRRTYDPMPPDALFGPTSYAGVSRFNGIARGHVVCAGLTPMGWARFLDVDAAECANRVQPLDRLSALAAPLRRCIAAAEDHAAAFDRFFAALLDTTAPEDPRIAAVFSLLLDPTVLTAEDLARRVDLTVPRLRRLTLRHFGFAPKLLLRRARFMRALIKVLAAPRGAWRELVLAAGYYDQSHFVRDCQLFLTCSLSEFMQRSKPLFEASLSLRAAVLGAPAQVLHPVEA